MPRSLVSGDKSESGVKHNADSLTDEEIGIVRVVKIVCQGDATHLELGVVNRILEIKTLNFGING